MSKIGVEVDFDPGKVASDIASRDLTRVRYLVGSDGSDGIRFNLNHSEGVAAECDEFDFVCSGVGVNQDDRRPNGRDGT